MHVVRSLVLATILAVCGLAAPALAHAGASVGTTNTVPPVVPALQEWTGGHGEFTLTRRSQIVAADRQLRDEARTLADDLSRISGQRLSLSEGSRTRTGDIVLRLGREAPDDREGYSAEITDTLVLTARTETGISRGTQTVEQLFALDDQHVAAPRGSIADWPSVAERGFMLDAGRKYYQPAYIEEQIRLAAWYKLNTVHLHLSEWNAFRLDSPEFPGLAAEDAYDERDIARFEQVAAKYDVTILPEIDLPAHATPITDYWPETRWGCAGMNDERGRNFTLDVTEPATRGVVRQLLDEFVPWFEGPRFHIGTDEYPYQSTQEQCPELVEYAAENGFANTSDVMVDFIDYMNGIVRRHGKTSVAWGWWDAAGDPTTGPDKNIVVEAYGDDVFDGGSAGAQHFLDQGYEVIYADGNQLYVTPGLDLLPDNPALYAEWPRRDSPNLRGYLMSRWSDDTETESDRFQDWFAHRAQQVTADRTWGAAAQGTNLGLENRADAIGPPPGLTRGYSAVSADAVPVSGEPYGSTPPFSPDSGFEKVFDGDPATYLDHSEPDGGYAGIDAGQATRVTKVRILPRSASATHRNRMIGGRLQGCTEGPTSGCVDLAVVEWQPPGYDWLQLPVYDQGRYRWLRYVGPAGGFANVAEVEFLTEPRRAVEVALQVPETLRPLARETVRATVRNNGVERLVDVEVDPLIAALDGGRRLSPRPSRAVRVPSLEPGQARTLSWTVDVPLDATPGAYRATTTAGWRSGDPSAVGRSQATASDRTEVLAPVTGELDPDTLALDPGSSATITLRLTSTAAEPVTVSWQADVPASAGLRVEPREGSVAVGAGQTTEQTLRVTADESWTGTTRIPIGLSADARGRRTTVEPLSLRITDGRLYLDGENALTRIGAEWTDYDYGFGAIPYQTGGGGRYAQAGWFFRAESQGTSYAWIIGNYPHPGAPDGNLTKVVFDDGAYKSVEVVPLPFEIRAGQEYQVRISVRGDVFTTYVDGTQVDQTTDATHARGRVGFRQDPGESASFDDVLVTAPDGTVLFRDDFSADLSQWEGP